LLEAQKNEIEEFEKRIDEIEGENVRTEELLRKI
jgi:hypothetical protein